MKTLAELVIEELHDQMDQAGMEGANDPMTILAIVTKTLDSYPRTTTNARWTRFEKISKKLR